MGVSTTSLLVDGYDVWWTRRYADRETLSLFQEADRRVRLRSYTSVFERHVEWASSWLTWAAADAAMKVDEDGSVVICLPAGAVWRQVTRDGSAATPPGLNAESDIQDLFAAHAYVSSVGAVRDRLDAMGFTREKAARVLAAAVATEIANIESELYALDEDGFAVQRLKVLRALTLEAWLDAFAWIKHRGVHEILGHLMVLEPDSYVVPPDETTPIVRYMLDRDDGDVFGFPRQADPRYLFRAALEACPPDAEVVLDLTAVISTGYYTERQRVVDEARAEQAARYPADAPTIVLTEGSTDGRAIQGALRVLYPHLQDIYSFMDFGVRPMRVPGSTSTLVSMVKAFVGAGVANRVVALFDNDAAGHNAMRAFSTIVLPTNVRVLHYPDLLLAATYPTVNEVGGMHPTDVNGAAASLEMYFGADVLRNAHGALTPVELTSSDPGTKRYQGKLRDKTRLQQRFAAKLVAAESDPATIADRDWSGMRAILDTLREAFA